MEKVLVVASSLDGYIAQNPQQISTAWTSGADKQWFKKISLEIGVLIMGLTTFQTMGAPLPRRKTIVLCERGKLAALPVENFRRDNDDRLYQSGGQSLEAVLVTLESQGVERVAICGGASVYQSFLQAGLVDSLYVTIEPVLLGGGVRLTGEAGLAAPVRLQLVKRLELTGQTTVFYLRVER